MTVYITTQQYTGRTLFVTAQRLSDGFYWDNNTSTAWESAPTITEKKIAMAEGSSENVGSYTASNAGDWGNAGYVRLRIHDDDDSDRVIGVQDIYVSGGVEVHPADVVRVGGSTGGTSGLSAFGVDYDLNARIDANVTHWKGTAAAATDTAGYVKATIKSGTGTGELSLSSGTVTVGTNNDKTGYSISGTLTTLDALDTAQDSQHATTQAAISALNDFNPASDTVTVATASVNAIADQVWDEATSGHATAGTFGKATSDILVDTAEIGVAGAGLTEAGGTGDQFTAQPWNSAWDTEVQSECNDALVALRLDHLLSTSATGTDVADNSIFARLVSKSATADWDSYNNTTDSLEALRDRGDAAWITATGFSTLDAAGVRTAIGLASANLDTQLGDIPTVAEFEARTLVAASYATAAALATVDGIVDAIVLDTNELQTDWVDGGRLDQILDQVSGATGTTIPGEIVAVQAVVDAILVDTGTTLPATLNTIDQNVDAILVDTGTTLPAAIAVVDAVADEILIDTNATIPGTLATIGSNVSAVKTKTDAITFTVANRVDVQVFGMQADTVTASALAADAVAEIQSGLATASALTSVAADATAILEDTSTTIPATLTTILADTNELQTDWANGGRLDVILDARASQTSVDAIATDVDSLTTAVGDVPTVAEFEARTLAAASYATAAALTTVDTVVDAIQAKTDQLTISGGDVVATLDGEQVELSATGLDAIPTTAPTGDSSTWTFVGWLNWLRRVFSNRHVYLKNANAFIVYADDGVTELTSQATIENDIKDEIGGV